MGTLFTDIYNRFFGKITDDMYLELTPEDTRKDLRALLIDSIPGFEFPRKPLGFTLSQSIFPYDANNQPIIDLDKENYLQNAIGTDNYFSLNSAVEAGIIDLDVDPSNNLIIETSSFDNELSDEEQNILALLMMCAWLQRQVTSIENTRMKYTSSDFKMTSQANHLAKLLTLLTECQRQSFHMQRLYKRRYHDKNGKVHSSWRIFGDAFDGIRF